VSHIQNHRGPARHNLEAAGQIDFDQPACLLLIAVAHFIPDTAALTHALARYRDALAPGSYLILAHASNEGSPEEAEKARQVYNRTTSPLVLRSREELGELLDGWQLVDPGLTECGRWRPEPGHRDVSPAVSKSVLVAVARKA